MKTIKLFLDSWAAYPTAMAIITIIGIFFAIKYRKQLINIIEYKFRIKLINRPEKLPTFCDDNGEIFKFKSHIVIPDYKTLYDSLKKQIEKSRKKGALLRLDFSELNKFNAHTKEAIRDNIREMIMENNIRCVVVFPTKGMNDVFKEMNSLIEQRSCHSIILKKEKCKTKLMEKK